MDLEKKIKNNQENKSNNNSMSELIRNLRAFLKLSQAAFAKSLSLSSTHIARFEKGIAVPTDETIDKICESFNIDRNYFKGALSIEEAISSEDVVRIWNPEIGIAERLKIAREEKGWSQNELAKRSGVSQPVVNRLEFGTKLTERQGIKLADTLEVGLDWLMRGDERKKNFPADQRMIDWLWEHEDIRKKIWKQIKESV